MAKRTSKSEANAMKNNTASNSKGCSKKTPAEWVLSSSQYSPALRFPRMEAAHPSKLGLGCVPTEKSGGLPITERCLYAVLGADPRAERRSSITLHLLAGKT